MPSRSACALVIAAQLLLAAVQLPAQEPVKTGPVDVGLEEHVEVQLVLVDVLVLDRRDRTIPDLDLDDFELLVDGREVEIASLDALCSETETDPIAVPQGQPRDSTPGISASGAAPAPQRQIVLALDYYHMDSAWRTLEFVKQALRDRKTGSERHMVVAIAEGLRVETPFTADLDEVLRALDRMQDDETLFAGNYGRLTETRVFERFKLLMDLMDTLPGRKVVILFSGPFQNDGFHHDPSFRKLGAMAARSRTSFYPVDSGGMRIGAGIAPPKLARLAVETGGRLTANTNDLTLGYARVQRDLGCGYTLGFYDRRPRLDRSRRMSIHVRRPGIRAVHPSYYVLRSTERRRKSLTRTAAIAPEMFHGGGLRTEVFPVRPGSTRKWDTLVTIGIPRLGKPEGIDAESFEWDLRGVIRTPSGAGIHKFKRKLGADELAGSGDEQSPFIIVEQARLRPGAYKACVVLAGPGLEEPLAAFRRFELPEIPKNVRRAR